MELLERSLEDLEERLVTRQITQCSDTPSRVLLTKSMELLAQKDKSGKV